MLSGRSKFLAWGIFSLCLLSVLPLLYRRFTRPHPTRTIAETERWFTSEFPTNDAFRQELHQLRMQARLSPENEQVILSGVQRTADVLDMPPAILWCLLFQESRLNHLAGAQEPVASVGLGQFSRYSFYEVNHHLTQFTDDNLTAFYRTIGRDVRPIHRDGKKLDESSSYFNIPTAVVSTAAYLNNRYLHLKKILDQNRISYEPELLWLYAALAYNKGTRSVLSFWKVIHRERGIDTLQDSLHELRTFSKLVNNRKLVRNAFEAIWPKWQAQGYSAEWLIHFKNTGLCALKPGMLEPHLDGESGS